MCNTVWKNYQVSPFYFKWAIMNEYKNTFQKVNNNYTQKFK